MIPRINNDFRFKISMRHSSSGNLMSHSIGATDRCSINFMKAASQTISFFDMRLYKLTNIFARSS